MKAEPPSSILLPPWARYSSMPSAKSAEAFFSKRKKGKEEKELRKEKEKREERSKSEVRVKWSQLKTILEGELYT